MPVNKNLVDENVISQKCADLKKEMQLIEKDALEVHKLLTADHALELKILRQYDKQGYDKAMQTIHQTFLEAYREYLTKNNTEKKPEKTSSISHTQPKA